MKSNKEGNRMNKKVKIFKFNNKVIRILTYISLLIIPILLMVIINNFNVQGLLFFLLISILLCFICYWCNTYKLVLYEDKFVLHNIFKKTFELDKIKSMSLEVYGSIKIVYNEKIYKIHGFTQFLSGASNEEKNNQMLKEINKNVLKKVRKGNVYNTTKKEKEVVGKKRMWSISFMLLFLLFDFMMVIGLISKWNTIIFWFTLIIGIIDIPLIFVKIFSPNEILIYDRKNKSILIKKLFKTIELSIDDVSYYYSSYRGNMLMFKTKNKKRIYIHGIKNIEYVDEKISNLINKSYLLFDYF
jgi:hypothetical protein